MPTRNGLRRRLKLLPAAALITLALPVATAAAQAPGLPRTFDATRIDSPTPVGGGSFGWGVWSADLTGDGKHDLLVAQGQVGTAAVPTRVFLFDGVTGAHVDTIDPPENNPSSATGAYSSPELAFVYVETMPDLGSCPLGDGADSDKICDDTVIGPGDGIPEIIVGARALRVNTTDGSLPPTLADPQVGRGYVIDGKTRAVLKRIDMPAADRALVLARNGANTTAAFARTMSSPQGMPPCAGLRSENNDSGVGPCPSITRGTGDTTTGSNNITNVDMPNAENGQMIVGPGLPPGSKIVSGAGTSTLTVFTPPAITTPPPARPLGAGATATATDVAFTATDPRYSQAVRIGDLDGGGQPDIVITARGWAETRGLTGSAAAASECKTNTTGSGATCGGAGKSWAYRGEDIVGTNPQTILETTMFTPTPSTCANLPTAAVPCYPGGGQQNPDAQAAPAGGEYGGNLFRVGDLAGDDGFPDYIIPNRGADLPLKAPDTVAGLNMGSAYLFNGKTGSVARTMVSPEPQIRSQFSGTFNAGRAVGDLGATATPDILMPAVNQNVQFADQGRLWVLNGDLTAGGGGEQSWNFGMLNDPEPYPGGNFGTMTGVGNIVDGAGAPANEVLIGGMRFDTFTEAAQNTVGDVNFMNATLDKNLMTIPQPDGVRGDGFGTGITPMGDLNNDGFLDFAVTAYLADGETGAQGRAWIFKSNNSPLPAPPAAPAPTPAGPITPISQDKPLQPGRCANRTVGTDATETLKGTLAGDQIFGFAGNDTIMGFEGQDCIDGAAGNDSLMGGDDADKLVGGPGADKLNGEDGRDNLYGSSGADRLEGLAGADMLAGGAGRDQLLGGSGDDRLFGEGGTDRIVGGPGRNHIDAGAGNDSIDARNGRRDRVICGTGRDTVRADSVDALNGCERVTIGGKIR
jgi:Ca2+-binding RTX toxin-like protein